MKTQDLDEFSDAPLSPAENQKMRKMIRDQERMDWLMASGRTWGGYIAVIGATWYAGKDYIIRIFKAIIAPGVS